MKNATIPSAIVSLVLIAFLFLSQRKQNRATQLLLQECLTRLELVESEAKQIEREKLPVGHMAVLKNKVKRLSKEMLIVKTTLASTKVKTSDSQPRSLEQRRCKAVFIDAANIEIAAQKEGLKILYRRLYRELNKASSEEVTAFYYTAVDEQNSNQIYFLESLKKMGYQLVTKKLIRHGNGSVEGNLDPEIGRDLMALSGSFDTAVLVSGDGDFTCFVEYLQQQQKRVEVVSFPRTTNKRLKKVADRFIDITSLPVFVNKVNAVKGLPVAV